MSVITQPCSDRVTWRNACGIVETASCTSQVRGLISFPNSLSPSLLLIYVGGDKAYKGLSAFIHQSPVAWREWGGCGEVKGTLRRRLSYGYFTFIAKYASN